jgi:hypothetical protein
MKNIYTLCIFSLLILFTSCSKDFLKKYDKRIVGTWRISDVDRFGFGGNIDNLPFTEGSFTFYEDGSLDYVNAANVSYTGSWDIVKKYVDNETLHSLKITAVNYTNMEVLSQYYDDMNFKSTNHFKAKSYSGLHTYVTSFRR